MLDVTERDSFGLGSFVFQKFSSGWYSWFKTFLIVNFGLGFDILNFKLDISTSSFNIVLVFFFNSLSRFSFIFLILNAINLNLSRFSRDGDLHLLSIMLGTTQLRLDFR